MMFLLIGVLISYCFIDAICDDIPQNRLIQSYENDTTVNITFVGRRALSVIAQPKPIGNFKGKRRKLLSVAKISRKELNPTTLKKEFPAKGGCTGSYIKSDTGDKFVVTAAHCVYNKKTRSWKGSVSDYRVEFGVTNAYPPRSNGIIECTVSDIIANREYTIEPPSKRYATDYAILKLGGCTGNGPKAEPFQLGPFRVDKHYWRAGYGPYRSLRRCKMTPLDYPLTAATASNIGAERRQYMNKALLATGTTRGGDSGGPCFLRKKSGGSLVLVAVCRGFIDDVKPLGKSVSIAAKLTPAVVREIKKWMAGRPGNSGVSILSQGGAVNAAHFRISNLIQRYIYSNKAYDDGDNVDYYDDDDDDDIESF